MAQLPAPSCTTDVYLAGVIERLDALVRLLQPPPDPPADVAGEPAPPKAPRKRAAPRP